MAAIAAPGIESPSATAHRSVVAHCAACSIVSGIGAEWSGFSAAIWLEAGAVAFRDGSRDASTHIHTAGGSRCSFKPRSSGFPWLSGSRRVREDHVLGALYGSLALWRKSLRPGMMAHAWSDILSGTFRI
jgi:hypothetical protein